MIFNSTIFLVFFAVAFAVYAFLPHRAQNWWLLATSYFFYSSWDWRFLSLLLLSTGVDYVLAKAIEDSTSPRRRRSFLVFSMCVSLGVLGFFKYFNFFTDNLIALLTSMGFESHRWHLNIILPWGISFYTFQTMNYTIDVYRGHMKASRNFLDFAVFVSFWPHLVAGPIMRASVLLPQVQNPRTLSWERARDASWLILWGLFKKVVIADNLATIVDAVFGGRTPMTAPYVLVGVYAFAFQIYGDFSGYSDMARGFARLMGFDLMINFNSPYFSRNPAEFWRRWHISLSTWLRDYLYIPLGGNRHGVGRTYINLALTMLLGGLWHGAAWTFVAWGAYQGLLLCVHRALAGPERHKPTGEWQWRDVWSIVVMFQLACVGWLLFRAESMEQVWAMLSGLSRTGDVGWPDLSPWLALVILCAPLGFVEYVQERGGDPLAPMRLSLVPRTALLAVIMGGLWALGNTNSLAFIYFQF
jgi:D-alanyl-lipoteichoic acid acyltransferase DltB (MBOAT superfamily)